ncbi:MAG: dihydrodipicolinate reductase [Rhodobacteraceae bacterium]|nr:dihydrodipicolinate reductase [Paracoccaceae bacterium]
MRFSLVLILMLVATPVPAFEPVTDGAQFARLVSGRALTRLGIRLEVHADGRITGHGMGRPVVGEWSWRQGYFCRSLFWGGDDLGDDCQAVLREEDRLRFVTMRGAGIFADFRLR